MDFPFDHKKENTPIGIEQYYHVNHEQHQQHSQFDFLNSKTLIIGKRETGKTSLVRDLYKKIQNDIHEVHIFSNVTSSYLDISNAIYSNFSLLEDFAEHCKKYHDLKKLLIIENVIDSKQLNLLEEVLYNGRFMNVTLIVTVQHPLVMKAEYRAQFDYIFAANDDFYSTKQRLYTYYFGMFPTLQIFSETLDSLQQFQFLCSKNVSPPYVTKYKPQLHTDVKFIQTQLIEKGMNKNNKKNQLIKQINETLESLIKVRDMLSDLL